MVPKMLVGLAEYEWVVGCRTRSCSVYHGQQVYRSDSDFAFYISSCQCRRIVTAAAESSERSTNKHLILILPSSAYRT